MSNAPPVFCGDLAVRRAEVTGPLATLTFDTPDAFASAAAGQFALLRSNRPGAPLLPRPLSVVDTAPLTFAFAVKGAGTRTLAAAVEGEAVYVMGPLGNTFSSAAEATLLVTDASHAGTLLALARERAAACAPADILYVREDAALDEAVIPLFAAAARSLTPLEEAGVGDALARRGHAVVAVGARDSVAAAVQRHARNAGWPGEVALQAPMACGLGACKICIRPLADHGTLLVCERPVVGLAKPVLAA